MKPAETVGRVWTAPLVQGGETKRILIECGCDRVSGLFAAARGRWPRWVPRSTPKREHGLLAAALHGFCGSSDRPISIFSLKPFTSANERSGGDRVPPICLTARHHGPEYAGHLVGQSHRHQLARLAAQQIQQPR